MPRPRPSSSAASEAGEPSWRLRGHRPCQPHDCEGSSLSWGHSARRPSEGAAGRGSGRRGGDQPRAGDWAERMSSRHKSRVLTGGGSDVRSRSWNHPVASGGFGGCPGFPGDFRNKASQTGDAKQQTVLPPRSEGQKPHIEASRGRAPAGGSRLGSSWPWRRPGAAGVPWLVAASHRSLPLSSQLHVCVCVSSPPRVRTPVIGFRAHLKPP